MSGVLRDAILGRLGGGGVGLRERQEEVRDNVMYCMCGMVKSKLQLSLSTSGDSNTSHTRRKRLRRREGKEVTSRFGR